MVVLAIYTFQFYHFTVPRHVGLPLRFGCTSDIRHCLNERNAVRNEFGLHHTECTRDVELHSRFAVSPFAHSVDA